MMRMLLLLLAALPAWAQCSGYSNSIPAQFEQVTANLSNYPAVISITSKLLATTANGGLSQSTGFDICFSDLPNLVSFPIQIRSYIATGTLLAVVKASLALAPTNVLLWIGKGSVSDPSSTSVWDSGFMQVYPLQETCTPGGSTASCFKDATATGNNSTTGNYPTQTAGLVGNAQSFNGSANYIKIVNALTAGTTATVSAWGKIASIAGVQYWIFTNGNNASSKGFIFDYALTTGFTNLFFAGSVQASGNAGLADGNWHFVTGTLTASPATVTMYVDGVQQGSIVTGTFTGFVAGNSEIGAGAFGAGAIGDFLTGTLQEIRVSNVARSAAWIAADYDSFHSPTTFFKLTNRTWGGPQ